MNIDYFFPTAIASFKIAELAEQMLPVAKKYLADPDMLTNQWGYKNTYGNAIIENSEEIKPYIEFITVKGKEFLEHLGYDSDKINFSTEVFVSEMFEGDLHGLHCHPNSLLSGLLYLQVPEGSSSIVFDDPRSFRDHIDLPKKGSTVNNWSKMHFVPETGLMLMWESWLKHEVPRTNNIDGRITMVFNLGWQR
jgi:uncharacterized protein (TIGR02466 family)